MQQGETVIIPTRRDCPQTNSGNHQAEDWCRMCGGSAGLKELVDENAQLRKKLEGQQGECVWSWGGDDAAHSTTCGEEFCLVEGTPEENSYNFCPQCGKPIREEKDCNAAADAARREMDEG